MLRPTERESLAYLLEKFPNFPNERALTDNGADVVEVQTTAATPSVWIGYNSLTREYVVYDTQDHTKIISRFPTYQELALNFSYLFDYEHVDSIEEATEKAWIDVQNSLPSAEEWRSYSYAPRHTVVFNAASGTEISWTCYYEPHNNIYVAIVAKNPTAGFHAIRENNYNVLIAQLKEEHARIWAQK